MKGPKRILIRLLIFLLPLTFALPSNASDHYAAVFNSKDGVKGGQMTGVTPTLRSNWNADSNSCNFVNQEIWLILNNSPREWIEVGVTDGKMDDLNGTAYCSGTRVKHWTGYFTAYQVCTSSSSCTYNEYPGASGSGVGSSVAYEIVKTDSGWASYAENTKVMDFTQFSQTAGQETIIGMEGNGRVDFGGTTSTSSHLYKVGTVWYSWCDGTNQAATGCTTYGQGDWTATFGGTSSSPDYSIANYADH